MKKQFTILDNGLPVGHDKVTTKEDADTLANNMYRSGHYPAGLSCCFTSGINGDWEDGICPFYGTEDCVCEDSEKRTFEDILKNELKMTLQEYIESK